MYIYLVLLVVRSHESNIQKPDSHSFLGSRSAGILCIVVYVYRYICISIYVYVDIYEY